ncbi:hypothetical protein ACXR2W_03720 [Leucobacter sp. HY1908]
MIVLGSVAVALIVAGVAAPQYLYALDAGKYGQVVHETSQLENEFGRSEVERDAAEVLLYLQQQEAASLAVRFSALAKADSAIVPKSVATDLADAAANITTVLDEAGAMSKAGAMAVIANELKEGEELNPVTWFAVTPFTVGEVADLTFVNADSPKLESTVTREVLEGAKTRHEEASAHVAESQQSLSKRNEQLKQLDKAVAGGLKAVDTVASTAPKSAKVMTQVEQPPEGGLLEADPELDARRAAVQDTALEAAETVAATEFVRGADGAVVRLTGATGVDPATVMTLTSESRSVVTLARVEAFVSAATTYVTEQKAAEQLAAEQAASEEAARLAAEEAARLAAEEAARQEEERRRQEETAPPPPPPVEPPPETPEGNADGGGDGSIF